MTKLRSVGAPTLHCRVILIVQKNFFVCVGLSLLKYSDHRLTNFSGVLHLKRKSQVEEETTSGFCDPNKTTETKTRYLEITRVKDTVRDPIPDPMFLPPNVRLSLLSSVNG